jgi:hypothetical protein
MPGEVVHSLGEHVDVLREVVNVLGEVVHSRAAKRLRKSEAQQRGSVTMAFSFLQPAAAAASIWSTSRRIHPHVPSRCPTSEIIEEP